MAPPGWWARARRAVAPRVPGTLLCLVVAMASTFLAEHHGGPQLLYALFLGLALNALASHPAVGPGIAFCARDVLRLGVALLGVRITLTQVLNIGWRPALIVLVAVLATIACGLLLARLLKRPRDEGLLSGCAVGICGASAALAVSLALPQTKDNERFTLLVVVGVTVLSSLTMVSYPLLLQLMAVSPIEAGVFLGGTIHDVAQVVAAGAMLGQGTEDAATLVKLFRVALLMPIVLVITVLVRRRGRAGNALQLPPLLPGFMIGFFVLMGLGSMGLFSPEAVKAANQLSRWMLVIAIAAAGIKTHLGQLAQMGWTPVVMLVGETVLIAAVVGTGLLLGLV